MESKKKSRYTEAQKKSIYKYRETKAITQLTSTPEQKEQIKEAAAKENKSVNQFILDCIFEHLEKQ